MKSEACHQHIEHHDTRIKENFEHPIAILSDVPGGSEAGYNEYDKDGFFQGPAILYIQIWNSE